jgi:hypothetical protein
VRAVERLTGTRIVATPAAIESAMWPKDARVFRLAPDEVFVDAAIDASWIDDPDAIVVRETGFSGVWIERATAIDFLQRECDWELPAGTVAGLSPRQTPQLAQGLVAGLPVKVWFEADRVLFFVASPLAQDFMERLR